ncbi:putative Solute carrier family 22 member 8 [Hypsibius exemplaris]|uniref:Solute carrier family 22 member 8 n=1 Tax=Hypsibius exemplaris TaxID=2072580 RepID=A0A9X6RJG7_HYPEX|nr:putative Solute carrier family 22 member 8 [Hypsibius exemplaris]
MSDLSEKSLDALQAGVKKLHRTAEGATSSTRSRKCHSKALKTSADVLSLLGDPGRFHYMQFFALCLQFTSLAMSDLIPIFYNLSPQSVVCRDDDPDNDHSTWPEHDAGMGSNASQLIMEKFVFRNDTSLPNYCRCREGALTYIYRDNRTTSLISEMNLVCEKAPLASLATTLYYVGSALAGPFMGLLSDRHGRRPVLLLCCLALSIVNIATIFVTNYILYVLLQCLSGITRVGIYSTTFILLMEWTPTLRRTVVAAASEFFFPAGVMALAVCAYYLHQWRHIQIALAASNSVFILNIWFAQESVVWLLANGKTCAANETIHKIAKFNGKPLNSEDLESVDSFAVAEAEALTESQSGIFDCLRDPEIRRITLLISVVWFAAKFGYSGLSYLIDTLSSNVAVDLLIGGSLELIPWAITFAISANLSSDKKYPISGFFAMAAVLAIAAGAIPSWSRLLALSSRMTIVGCLSLMFMHAAELLPTAVRSSGFGVAMFFFMVGGMVSPQLVLLASFVAIPGIPVFIVGGVSLLGALAVLALPLGPVETTKTTTLYRRLE